MSPVSVWNVQWNIQDVCSCSQRVLSRKENNLFSADASVLRYAISFKPCCAFATRSTPWTPVLGPLFPRCSEEYSDSYERAWCRLRCWGNGGGWSRLGDASFMRSWGGPGCEGVIMAVLLWVQLKWYGCVYEVCAACCGHVFRKNGRVCENVGSVEMDYLHHITDIMTTHITLLT